MKHLAWCLAGHRARGQSRASPPRQGQCAQNQSLQAWAGSVKEPEISPAASGAAHTQKERLPDETQDTVKFECHCLSEIQI